MKNGKNMAFEPEADDIFLSLSEDEKVRLTAKADLLNISVQKYVNMLVTSHLDNLTGGKAKKKPKLH